MVILCKLAIKIEESSWSLVWSCQLNHLDDDHDNVCNSRLLEHQNTRSLGNPNPVTIKIKITFIMHNSIHRATDKPIFYISLKTQLTTHTHAIFLLFSKCLQLGLSLISDWYKRCIRYIQWGLKLLTSAMVLTDFSLNCLQLIINNMVIVISNSVKGRSSGDIWDNWEPHVMTIMRCFQKGHWNA